MTNVNPIHLTNTSLVNERPVRFPFVHLVSLKKIINVSRPTLVIIVTTAKINTNVLPTDDFVIKTNMDKSSVRYVHIIVIILLKQTANPLLK